MKVKLKRAREPATRSDGYRVLVERLWPRGVAKKDLPMDEWAKDIAPSTELRKWFGHDPARWTEFQRRYRRELQADQAKAQLRALAAHDPVTLIFSSKDGEHNNAVVLQSLLQQMRGKSSA